MFHISKCKPPHVFLVFSVLFFTLLLPLRKTSVSSEDNAHRSHMELAAPTALLPKSKSTAIGVAQLVLVIGVEGAGHHLVYAGLVWKLQSP